MANSTILSAVRVRPARGVTAQPASPRPVIDAIAIPGMEGPPGPGGSVNTVNGMTGTVILTKNDVGLGNVANLLPSAMPVSTAQSQADSAVQAAAATDATAKASAAQSAAIAVANTKAAKGANSDITSLSGLTTPLSRSQGGLGNGTGDASGLIVTESSSASAGSLALALSAKAPLSPSAGIGQLPGTGDLPLTTSRLQFYGWDGSQQARVATVRGSVEFVTLMGGASTKGPVIKADSDVNTNVNLNIVAAGTGSTYFMNYNGVQARFYDAGISTSNNIRFTGSAAGVGVFVEAEGQDSNIDVGLLPKGLGSILAAKPDGTIVGGNSRGLGSVDLQGPSQRTAATQVASGLTSIILGGGANTASGNRGVVLGGYGNFADGSYSATLPGQNATARGRYGTIVRQLKLIRSPGDSQEQCQVLTAVTTSSAAVRMTSDGNTATASGGFRNSVYAAPKSVQAFRIELSAVSFTTAGRGAAYFNTLMLMQGANAAATTTVLGTPVTMGDAITVTITADTTLGGLNVTVAPPAASANDEWHFTMRLAGTETL